MKILCIFNCKMKNTYSLRRGPFHPRSCMCVGFPIYIPGVGVWARCVIEKSTLIRRPSISIPEHCSFATLASSLDSKYTKQNPLDLPV